MDRIKKLCGYLSPCATFADVGCDHGYCTQYMLERNLCRSAVISDVSAGSLSKAEKLLKDYIERGVCRPQQGYGLDGISSETELVLIAGMGGEEIVAILKRGFIPKNFVLQPMHNAKKLREYLLECGAEIVRDDVFACRKKYYPVLCGRREGGKSEYSEAELAFGKGDIGADFGDFVRSELQKNRLYLSQNPNPESAQKIKKYISLAEEVLKN